jgi:anti-sigma regulatory factor (Ser/Thr protein kinase)
MAETPPRVLSLTILSDPKYVRIMRGAIFQAAAVAGFTEQEAQQMTLAVDEGCTNIIKYGYCGDCTKKIHLSCRISDGEIEIRIRDFGKKSSPEQIKSPPIGDIRPGGLGVMLMHKIMDVVEYNHGKRVGTELRLVKKVKARREAPEAKVQPRSGSG